jgi:hypothetical protein
VMEIIQEPVHKQPDPRYWHNPFRHQHNPAGGRGQYYQVVDAKGVCVVVLG